MGRVLDGGLGRENIWLASHTQTWEQCTVRIHGNPNKQNHSEVLNKSKLPRKQCRWTAEKSYPPATTSTSSLSLLPSIVSWKRRPFITLTWFYFTILKRFVADKETVDTLFSFFFFMSVFYMYMVLHVCYSPVLQALPSQVIPVRSVSAISLRHTPLPTSTIRTTFTA